MFISRTNFEIAKIEARLRGMKSQRSFSAAHFNGAIYDLQHELALSMNDLHDFNERITKSFTKGFEEGCKFEARESKYDRDYLNHEIALLMNELHDLKIINDSLRSVYKMSINTAWREYVDSDSISKQSYCVMYYPRNITWIKSAVTSDHSLDEAIKIMNRMNYDNPEAPGFFTIEVF